MKKIITMIVASGLIVAANAQTNISLKLNHYWNGEEFNYGQVYTNSNGNAVSISRVQYYLSGFNVTHDDEQSTDIAGRYVLASANITNYYLGAVDFTTLESIKFDLGIDAATNHLDPETYPGQDPLALQTPSMQWGWSAGYNFLVINGKVDSNGDGTPDKTFEFHVVGDDDYLRSVSEINTTGESTDAGLDVNVSVNIADWLFDIDLITAGLKHGVYTINEDIMNNTNPHTVFNTNVALGLSDNSNISSNIFFDYTLPYAPTIFYKIPTANSVNIEITDINGRVVLKENNLPKAGNFFINKELVSGTYIAKFITNNGIVLSNKFIVQQ